MANEKKNWKPKSEGQRNKAQGKGRKRTKKLVRALFGSGSKKYEHK